MPGRRRSAPGFVIDKSGHIVTNYHVVEGADEVTVSFSNRDTVRPRSSAPIRRPTSRSFASTRPRARLTLSPLGNSDAVRVGDPVVAIGNPFGLDRTVTSGIVSALQRLIRRPNRFTIDHVIQTDAPINHGNSGGPLLNARGQVIGVNTQIETGRAASAPATSASASRFPSNTVKDVVAQILRTGRVDHAYLGISGQALTADVADTYNLPVEGGRARRVGHGRQRRRQGGPQGGETEVVVAGETYVSAATSSSAFDGEEDLLHRRASRRDLRHKPGDKVKLVIYRDADKSSVTVTLGRQPSSPQG